MESSVLVSILILNWNGESILDECITSILKSEYQNYEIVVVDNNSSDRSLEVLSKYPGLKVISNRENLGFAGGNNIGFRHCEGRYIVTLNNDIIVEPNWLTEPVRILESDNAIGIIGCRQMSYFNREVIDSLYLVPTAFLLLDRMGKGKIFHDGEEKFTTLGYTIGASGASVIYRKTLLNQLGGFDERFFAYHEESDLHLRAFASGWKCLYVPSSVVYHKGSYSFSKAKKTFFYLHERNRIWYVYKNFPASFIFKNLPVIIYRELRTFVNVAIRRGLLGTYLRARIDAFKELKQFKDERKKNVKTFLLRKHIFCTLRREKIIPADEKLKTG